PQFVFRLYFLMLDRQRSIVSGHLSVMLSGNWVTRPFRTFFKHASAFNKVLGCGQLAPPCGESNELRSMRPRFCSRSEKIPACVQRVCSRDFELPTQSTAPPVHAGGVFLCWLRIGGTI